MLGFIVSNPAWDIEFTPKKTQIQTACADVLCSQVPFPSDAADFPDMV